MKVKRFLKSFSLILVFGLCIAMLSRGAEVSAAENEPKLNVSSVSIIRDGSYRLKVYNLSGSQSVVYRSADPYVAMVSKTGKVTGITCGETVISAIVVENGTIVANLKCDVLIGPAAVSIKLTKAELVLQMGKMKALRTIISPLNTVESPTFYSEDTTIAKVSSAGRVRAEAEGTVQIYAFLSNGQSAVCTVTVLSKEDYKRYQGGESLEDILESDEEEFEPEDDGVAETEISSTVTPVTGSATSIETDK